MSDLGATALWLVVLGGGLAACVALRALGVAATYVRDLLHVGTGVWVLGWPGWHTAAPPIAITALAAIAVALVPLIAHRSRLAARVHDAVTGGDERWTGLVHYTLAYALLTAIGLLAAPFPAAAGLLALSLGDGLGGAVGRALGCRFYRTWGKRKSLEGSAAVAGFASVGIAIAGAVFAVPLGPNPIVALGLLAALVEALAPRGTDNLLVPAAVAAAAALAT